uniref:Methionine aminopeptidase n=1 Tax=Globodera rostochiensis TaxID=31243 RepID=A0A914I1Q5_GLORO
MTPGAGEKLDEVSALRQCESKDCDNSVEGNLRCPTCVKLGRPDAFFCSQKCFKASWSEHKACHDDPSSKLDAILSEYNPWPLYRFTGALRPGMQSARRAVPEHFQRPDYATHPEGVSLEERNAKNSGQIRVLTEDEQLGIRLAAKLGREVLDEAARAIAAGVTTDEVDRVVHEACLERECYPSPLGYYKFPKSCCTSVNEVICHGIPDKRALVNGDICNVDVTVFHRGFHGDLNETFLVGDAVSEEKRKLIAVTYECICQAIDIVRPGVKFREIGNVIQKHANANGFSVVRRYCGHGIHRLFHTAPNVPHYAKNKTVGVMKAGNAFTIEPMINAGSYDDDQWPDGWTAVTKDGRPSAQFEQTMLVTETGCDVLTERAGGRPWFMDQLEQLGYNCNNNNTTADP